MDMDKIGIFYGSTTGNTAEVAKMIAEQLGVADADVHDVAKTAPSAVAPYSLIILGSSTWGDGDLQDDFSDFLDGLAAVDLKGKRVAIFGCGDESMTDTFCNAVGTIYKRMQPTGATFVGSFNTDGYEFDHSDAVVDGKAEGLLIDQVNHPEMTTERVKEWCAELKA